MTPSRSSRAAAKAKFDETVEIASHLGVDPRHSDQLVRGTVVLPHGTGKSIRVLVFTKGEKEKEAQAAGADYVGADEYAKKIQEGWTDVDAIIATPDMMGELSKLGRILGPRGLMPNPKSGTVTFDVAKAVKELKAGKIEYRVDKGANVHAPVGKASFSEEQLYENALAFLRELVRAKPAAAKGTYLKSVTMSSTMGPGVAIDPQVVLSSVKAWRARRIRCRPQKKKRSSRTMTERLEGAKSIYLADFSGMTVEKVIRAAREVPRGGRRVQGHQEHAAQARGPCARRDAARRIPRGADRPGLLDGERSRTGPRAGRVREGRTRSRVVKAGLIGDKLYNADEVKQLASLPPRDVLLAQVLGTISAPLSQFLGAVNALARVAGPAGGRARGKAGEAELPSNRSVSNPGQRP